MDEKEIESVDEIKEEVVGVHFISQFRTDTVTDPEDKLFKCTGTLYQYIESLDGTKYDRSLELYVEDKEHGPTVDKVLETLYRYAWEDEGWKVVVEPELKEK